MRRYAVATFDSKTGMRLIYSECSYNMACFQLEKEMFEYYGKIPISATPEGNMMRIEFTDDQIFYYDEERGYLLKKESMPKVVGWAS